MQWDSVPEERIKAVQLLVVEKVSFLMVNMKPVSDVEEKVTGQKIVQTKGITATMEMAMRGVVASLPVETTTKNVSMVVFEEKRRFFDEGTNFSIFNSNSPPPLIKQNWNKLKMRNELKNAVLDGIKFKWKRKPPRKARFKNFVKSDLDGEVDKKWQLWKNSGVLESGETILVMAIGAVPKKNGKIRVIHDCRPLNKCVEEKRFSLDGIVEVAKFIKSGDGGGVRV